MSPRLFELAGQGPALAHLEAALSSRRLHHALLFTGPDGVGKHQAAMALAHAQMCREPEGIAACGRCPACVRAATAGHVDVHVLDPEERMIKVDHVRDATHALHLTPVEGPFKVLVVRDADRMNAQAQNALLKTLEEPPGGGRIVLTTSRPHTLLVTVQSRCQRVPFLPVPSDAIAALLVARRGLAPEEARLLAGLGAGSPGLAMSLDLDTIRPLRDRAAELDAQLHPDRPDAVPSALDRAEELAADPVELRSTLEMLGIWLRDQILLASGSGDGELANVDRRDELERLAQHRGLYEVLRRSRALNYVRAQLDAPFNLNPLMQVEQLCLALAGQISLEGKEPARA